MQCIPFSLYLLDLLALLHCLEVPVYRSEEEEGEEGEGEGEEGE